MRDPNRIPVLLDELQKTWKSFPDWRLGQLLSNAARACGKEDPFFLEDNELLESLKSVNEMIRKVDKYKDISLLEDGAM